MILQFSVSQFPLAPPVSVSRPHIRCSLPRGALHTKQDLTPAASTAAHIAQGGAKSGNIPRLDEMMTAKLSVE